MAGIPQIVIEQQFGQIGVRNVYARMRIEQHLRKMDIKTQPPKMHIERKLPQFRINWKKVNAEMGLKTGPQLSKDFSDKGKETALRETRRRAEDGNFLGNIRNPGDRVGQLARNRKMEEIVQKTAINIGLMPKSPPELDWDKGVMRIDWSKHSLLIDWDKDYMPRVTVDPKNSVHVFIRVEPYFRIMVKSADEINTPGQLVDKAV